MSEWIVRNCVAWTDFEGQVMAISPETSVLHRFNETGSFIWRNLTDKRSLEQIVQVMVEEFRVTTAQAEADLSEFLTRLAKDKLVESRNRGGE